LGGIRDSTETVGGNEARKKRKNHLWALSCNGQQISVTSYAVKAT